MDSRQFFLEADQLRVGIYVHLDLGWMDHPFTFNNFKIKTEKQLSQVKGLGLKRYRYDPLRSDCEPLPKQANTVKPEPQPAAATEEQEPPAIKTSQFRNERLSQLHQAIHECEKKFLSASTAMRQAARIMQTQPRQVVKDAEALVSDMVESVMTESDVVLHAMNGENISEDHYVHALNVSVLALVLAKSLDMTMEDTQSLGMGALFHDIGKSEIPDRVLLKTDPLTKAEQSLIEQHTEIGARLAREAGLNERVAAVALQHHECADGTGYPSGLKLAQIDPLARLVAIVNTYDTLCNPLNPAQSMTPYEALSHMFATQRNKFDSAMLKQLIKCLGVYPPGSIVYLSSGEYGIVLSVNPSKPLRPFVMLHQPDAPREEPVILDLSEQPSVNITKCLRANQLPKEAYDYLSPRKRICYFFDKDKQPES